jgi:hypothetical protein
LYADRDPEIRHITGGELDTNKNATFKVGIGKVIATEKEGPKLWTQ